MGNLGFTMRDSELRIEGYPNAEAIVKLEGHQEGQFKSLFLHRGDLEFCLSALSELGNLLSQDNKNHVLAQSLWLAVIVRFFYCFGSSKGRIRLNENKIFKGQNGALDVFNYFKNLRDKHLVHDENSYNQCFVVLSLTGNRVKKMWQMLLYWE
ncbi:MAG: hypothetical protein ACM3SR_02745 [Ignavibacteriales bacterium]